MAEQVALSDAKAFERISQILIAGSMTTSYKFALLRALADHGRNNGGEQVDLMWLADRFLAYYWPLALHSRVGQERDPARPARVMTLLQSLPPVATRNGRISFDRFRQDHPAQYESLVGECRTTCFGDVLHRFHQGPAGVEPGLSDGSHKDPHLRLRPGVREFLRVHWATVRALAIGGWVRWNERISSAPRLYEKIEGLPPSRRGLPYLDLLLFVGENRCFYCGTTDPGTSWHQDHVIPFAYVYEDRVWNLVPACPSCNGKKSDAAPAEHWVDKLNQRNHVLRSALQTAGER